MRKLGATAVALCGLAAGAARAQDAAEAQPPELDFLEYLGTWAEDDDEWLAIEEWQKDNGRQSEDGKDGNEDSGGEDADDQANEGDDDAAD